jgi:hypothetical protein
MSTAFWTVLFDCPKVFADQKGRPLGRPTADPNDEFVQADTQTLGRIQFAIVYCSSKPL